MGPSSKQMEITKMKYNIRIYCTRMSIAALSGAGMMGLLREIIPVSLEMQGNSLLVFLGMGVLTTIVVNEILKFLYIDMVMANKQAGKDRYYKTYPEQRNSTRFEKRMSIIIQIANKNMDKANAGKKFPVRDTVVVECEDLLKIWNLAELAKSETPVED